MKKYRYFTCYLGYVESQSNACLTLQHLEGFDKPEDVIASLRKVFTPKNKKGSSAGTRFKDFFYGDIDSTAYVYDALEENNWATPFLLPRDKAERQRHVNITRTDELLDSPDEDGYELELSHYFHTGD